MEKQKRFVREETRRKISGSRKGKRRLNYGS